METSKSLYGLDMLANQYRKKREEKKDDEEQTWYNDKLEDFRKVMMNRLKVYDPYAVKADPIDYGMYSLWLSYNWGDLSLQQLHDKKK
jgi:hypothetical protein